MVEFRPDPYSVKQRAASFNYIYNDLLVFTNGEVKGTPQGDQIKKKWKAKYDYSTFWNATVLVVI